MKNSGALGDPAIDIGGFRIWIHNREFPDAKEYWDANWVNVTTSCADEEADASAKGAILHLSEIEAWLDQLIQVYESLSGEARLECVEPNLGVVLACDKLGHLTMDVTIAQDSLSPPQSFTILFDQTHLRDLIAGCRKILEEYPVKHPLEARS